MRSFGELLSKVKKVNKMSTRGEIFNVDDILVEMAILQMSQTVEEHVFYFRVEFRGKKKIIRRTYDQIKALHLSFGSKIKTKLPVYSYEDNLMYLRLAKYLNLLKTEINSKKDKKILQRLVMFFEANYDILDDNIMGEVIKCGWARKQPGGRYKGNKAWDFIKNFVNCCWKTRFFILTEEGIGYTNKIGDRDFRDALLFDHTLRVRVGIHYTEQKFGIVLYTSSRRLMIKVRNGYELADWIEGIVDSISRSPYCKDNRFNSFSPVRQKNWCKSYINAHEYYSDLAADLERARSEIYITDWWLSPEVYLVRPIPYKQVVHEDG